MGRAIFSFKIHFLKKCLVVAPQTLPVPGGRSCTCKVPGRTPGAQLPPIYSPAGRKLPPPQNVLGNDKNPTRGDWASFASQLLEKYNLNLSLEEIKNMKTNLYKKLVKNKMKEVAFRELTLRQKKGEKGRTIVYNNFSMADYLLPEANLTVSEKVQIFSLRSEMNDNPCNFGEKIKCQMGCSQIQQNEHILKCPELNNLIVEQIQKKSKMVQYTEKQKFSENSMKI